MYEDLYTRMRIALKMTIETKVRPDKWKPREQGEEIGS